MSSYKEYKENLKEKQSDKSYDQVKEMMQKRNEFLIELDNLQPQKHLWIDRGLKQTCENAGHAYHEAWKIRKPMAK